VEARAGLSDARGDATALDCADFGEPTMFLGLFAALFGLDTAFRGLVAELLGLRTVFLGLAMEERLRGDALRRGFFRGEILCRAFRGEELRSRLDSSFIVLDDLVLCSLPRWPELSFGCLDVGDLATSAIS
jgi:hypothetical protein